MATMNASAALQSLKQCTAAVSNRLCEKPLGLNPSILNATEEIAVKPSSPKAVSLLIYNRNPIYTSLA
jgi:hypothetical protein